MNRDNFILVTCRIYNDTPERLTRERIDRYISVDEWAPVRITEDYTIFRHPDIIEEIIIPNSQEAPDYYQRISEMIRIISSHDYVKPCEIYKDICNIDVKPRKEILKTEAESYEIIEEQKRRN